jgi:hypothetical protein
MLEFNIDNPSSVSQAFTSSSSSSSSSVSMSGSLPTRSRLRLQATAHGVSMKVFPPPEETIVID